MESFFFDKKHIKNNIACGCAFALWRKPNEKKIHQTQCTENELIKINHYAQLHDVKGFVFAPFQISESTPIYVLPITKKKKIIDFNNKEEFYLQASSKEKSVSKEEYVFQCNSFIQEFENKGIKKAVLAQNQYFTKYSLDELSELFYQLCQAYPSAFVYQVFIPKAGYWLGATPELLLKINKQKAQTVALAATQAVPKNVKNIKWEEKEIKEQALVAHHIRRILTEFDINDYDEKPVKTIKAGDIAHLKTEITFDPQKIKNEIGRFIEKLHPTPAVCGLPVKKALKLIKQTENFNREYYAGFLGEFDLQKNIHLFVNLRCLKVFDNSVCLYSGAGITPQSEPDKEWEETQIKMQTLLKIIENQQIG